MNMRSITAIVTAVLVLLVGTAALAQGTPSPPLCFPSLFQALANMRRACMYTVIAALLPSILPTREHSPLLSIFACL